MFNVGVATALLGVVVAGAVDTLPLAPACSCGLAVGLLAESSCTVCAALVDDGGAAPLKLANEGISLGEIRLRLIPAGALIALPICNPVRVSAMAIAVL